MPIRFATVLHPQVLLAMAPKGDTAALSEHLAHVVELGKVEVDVAGAVLDLAERKPSPPPEPTSLGDLVVAARRQLERTRARGWRDEAREYLDKAEAFKRAVEG